MTIKELMDSPEVQEATNDMSLEDIIIVVKLLEGFMATKEEIDMRYNIETTDEQLIKFAAEVARIHSTRK